MKILLDECVPKRLAQLFPTHSCVTVPSAGWAGIKIGRLLALAASAYDVFLTVDRNLSFQNTVVNFDIAVVVVAARSTKLEVLAELCKLRMQLVRLRLGRS